jgi:HD-like signal output (HDOD) protein
MSAADQILDIELPPRPVVLQHLGLEMQKEDPDFVRVSELVNSDVGLGAAVVKVANSPYVGLGRRISSVQQAILYLGLGEVFSLVTGLLLRRSFESADPAMDRLWELASHRAALMSWLAREVPGVPSDRAYTCGLFEDCGMAVLLLRAPGYAHTLAQIEAAPNPQELERAQHGLDHVVLSQALVRAWGLPDSIATAVRHHHAGMELDRLQIPEESRLLIALSMAANEALARRQGRTRGTWVQEVRQVGAVLRSEPQRVEARLEELLAMRAAA